MSRLLELELRMAKTPGKEVSGRFGQGGAVEGTASPDSFWASLPQPTWVIAISLPMETLNKFVGKRAKWAYHNYRVAIEKKLTDGLLARGLWRRIGPLMYAVVELESVRKRLLEYECNLTPKAWIDALVVLGVLRNDHNDTVRRRALQRKPMAGESPRTIVRIWELKEAPPVPGGSSFRGPSTD